jgi:hypothetical protein
MFGFVLGFAAAVIMSVVFPVTYGKFMAYVTSFWNKVKEDENTTPEA